MVVYLLVRGIEVASEQGQNLLTATASLYLAYMSVMANTAFMIVNGAMGGGAEAERQLLPDLHGIHGHGLHDEGEAARTSDQAHNMDIADEFAGDDEYYEN